MKLIKIYEQIITEMQDQHGFAALIPLIEPKLKIKVGNYIASGTRSDVFDLGSNKVLKITNGSNDANGMMFSKEHPEFPLPKVFKIFKIDPSIIPEDIKTKSGQRIWIIISEKLKMRAFDIDEQADLEDWFLNNTKYKPDDIHSENMGIRVNGTIIYLDPSFSNIENDLSKIPILK